MITFNSTDSSRIRLKISGLLGRVENSTLEVER